MAGRIRTDAQSPERRVIRVLATAGHVDHGKSTLVEALTGTHPDRLKEEREREMSIDLGFAYLTLPNGVEVGIVDVPGHRDFIANMVAGVGGVDAVLLVVAADEGVMPQTQEHVAILDLLGVSTGLVALTKVDLVTDAAWLDLVEEEVRDFLRGTSLAQAPILRVSARTGEGLSRLREVLGEVLAQGPRRVDKGRPRLPIDRVFTLVGFGTVVTGTLMDGTFSLGEEVEILPQGLRARIRGIQTHKRPRKQALPGTRTALNLSGVAKDDLARGDVVTKPGTYRSTRRMDVFLRVLAGAPMSLRHNQWLKLHVWTTVTMARLRLLGTDELPPGATGWAQLELQDPVVVEYGDRFILRRPSPEATVAGGMVLDPTPPGRHRRWDTQVHARLEALYTGDALTVVRDHLYRAGYLTPEDLDQLPLSSSQGKAALQQGMIEGWVRQGEVAGRTFWVHQEVWQAWHRDAEHHLTAYHRRYPWRRGMPLAELRARLDLPSWIFEAWLEEAVEANRLVVWGERVALAAHRPSFPSEVQSQIEALFSEMRSGERSPSVRMCVEMVGEEIYQALVDLGYLVPLDDKYVLDRETFSRWRAQVRQALLQQGPMTVAQIRDFLGVSRRLAVAFLEHLDARGDTRREGDLRSWQGE